MTTNTFYQTVKDGTEINVMRWVPDGEIKGVVQMSHGMCEHSARYDKLGSIFADHGFVFCAHDHRGHGKTALKAKSEGAGDFGYLADKDGFNTVTDDLKEVVCRLKEDYPGKKTFLIGHSFGSFVAQNFIEKYAEEIDGVVLVGTAGPEQALNIFGKFVFGLSRIFGKKRPSKFDDFIAFSSYNKRFKSEKNSFAWLSRNSLNVELYQADQWCGFPATAGFFYDLVCGRYQIHKASNMKKIPQNLPVYITFGEEDPVGSYGKTPKKLFEIYKANGISDLEIKGWPQDRHEIFNETDGDDVIEDTIKWVEKHL